MELQNPFSPLSTTLYLFLFLLFNIVKRSKCKNSTSNLPPGPWKLPLIGNIQQFIGSMPHHSLRNLAAKYGPLMHLKLGEVSSFVVSSPEIAKQIIKTHDLIFSNRPFLLTISIVSYNSTNIAFSPYGGYWRQLRKICTVELLTAKRVQSFRSIREEEVSALIKAISSSEGSIINLSEKLDPLAYGITARAAFGRKFRNQEEFICMLKDVVKMAGGFSVADLFPSIKFLPMISGMKAKLVKLHREIDEILTDIVRDHKIGRSSINGEEEKEDLVDVLLAFQQQNELEFPLTDENIKAVILDIIGAGSETSSVAVEWAMSEMIKNPEVMEEAQAEVRRVFDNRGYVDESDMHQLIYLKCVIKETLRLHPSLPLLVPRESFKRCEINGYEIPAKSKLIINAWAIGRDPKYWTEAERFDPKRFLDSSIDYRGTYFEFLPFGGGRRMCPGITFAMANIELPLAQLLYHFDWSLPNGSKYEELDMSESFGITVRRKNDLCLIPMCYHP